MDKYSTIVFFLLLSSMLLFGGCLGEKAQAATSIKYVCSDGSIVSESRECRTEEKTCASDKACSVPAEKPCVCDRTTAEQNLSASLNGNVSAGPCESMGCPPEALFVGNSETKKFHECDCAQAAKLSPKKRVCFVSAKYALSLGYVPCGFCKPADPKT
jgi:hypothetical protein